MSRLWIETADRMPDEDGVYLAFAESADPRHPLCITAHYRVDDGWLLAGPWPDAISHWMPLPEPPKVGRLGKRPHRN